MNPRLPVQVSLRHANPLRIPSISILKLHKITAFVAFRSFSFVTEATSAALMSHAKYLGRQNLEKGRLKQFNGNLAYVDMQRYAGCSSDHDIIMTSMT